MTSNDNATIYTLGDCGLRVDGSANDVRGREVSGQQDRFAIWRRRDERDRRLDL